MRRLFLYSLLCALFLVSCSDKNSPEPTSLRGEILQIDTLKYLTVEDVARYAKDSISLDYLHYPVRCYRLTYSSVYEGEPIATTALMLLPDDEKAAIVKRIFELYLSGASIIAIINTLEEDKIPSPKGSGTWSKKTISTILTNAKYTGNVQVLKSNPGRNSYCM